MNWKLVWAVYEHGTDLVQSRTPGAKRGTVRKDGSSKFAAQADLFPAGREVKMALGAAFAAGFALCAGAVWVTPHVRRGFNDIRSKLKCDAVDAVEATPHKDETEQDRPLLRLVVDGVDHDAAGDEGEGDDGVAVSS